MIFNGHGENVKSQMSIRQLADQNYNSRFKSGKLHFKKI